MERVVLVKAEKRTSRRILIDYLWKVAEGLDLRT